MIKNPGTILIDSSRAYIESVLPAHGKVLLIDDDPHVLRAYSRVLSAAGHTVVSSGDPRASLALLEQDQFDVVLSDIAMPGMDGLELLRAIRGRDLDLPVVLITAAPSVDSAVRAVEYGALRYLVKPIDIEALEKTIQDAIHLRQLAKIKRETLAHLGLTQGAADRAGLEASFERALAGLYVVFQPIVSWSRRTVFAHEALVRTTEKAFPHPGVLLSAAERLDRLHDVGRAVRTRVSEVMTTAEPTTTFFVNVHTRDLLDADLYDPAAALTRLAPRVVLEITERAALDVIPDVATRLAALRRAGFRLALDD